MSSFIPKQLAQSQIDNVAIQTLYTAPANTKAVVKEIIISNPTAGAVNFDLYFVPSAGTASAANQIYKDEPVAGKDQSIISLNTVIETGGTIRAQASAATSLVATISGMEVIG